MEGTHASSDTKTSDTTMFTGEIKPRTGRRAVWLGELRAPVPARLATIQRSVVARAALCCEVAQWATQHQRCRLTRQMFARRKVLNYALLSRWSRGAHWGRS